MVLMTCTPLRYLLNVIYNNNINNNDNDNGLKVDPKISNKNV